MGPKFNNGDRVVFTDACDSRTYGCIIGPIPDYPNRWAVMVDGRGIQVWPEGDTEIVHSSRLPTSGWMVFYQDAWLFTDDPAERGRWQVVTSNPIRSVHVVAAENQARKA